MSYDVSLYISTGADKEAQVYESNHTSNCSGMWEDAGVDLRTMKGTSAKDQLPILKQAVETLRANPEKYRAMNPPNGWGSYESALRFIENLANACEENPACTIYVWY
jgi:hypothetical protein